MTRRREFLSSMIPAAGLGLDFQTGGVSRPEALSGLSVWNVLDFGARPDQTELSTEAIQQAMRAAQRAGGGIAYVPPGRYVTGTLEFLDHVTLYLEAGAFLQGSGNRRDYRQGCLLYAEQKTNFGLAGRGVIDGNGTSFWKWDAEARRFDKPHLRGRWVVGEWRPNRLLKFIGCEDIWIEDLTIQNSPAWTLHLIECDRVRVQGVSILNGVYENDGPNTDGIVPDGCSRVRISDCYVQTGDDSIVLKIQEKGRGKGVCRDITVTNCVLITSESALKIGSGTHGEFRNITFSNCVIRDAGCGIGLWMYDGGVVDGWVVNNVSMTLQDGGQPIYLWSYRRTDDTPWGAVKNIMISNVAAEADGSIFISGVPERPIESVTLDNIRLLMKGGREKKDHANPGYPYLRGYTGNETVWGHRHSPYDIFCRHVDDLTLRNIHLTWGTPEKAEWGSAMRGRNLRNLDIGGFVGRQASRSEAPAIDLHEVRGAFIHNCRAPEETGTFLKIGSGCRQITLVGNDLAQARKVAVSDPGVEPLEFYQSANRQ